MKTHSGHTASVSPETAAKWARIDALFARLRKETQRSQVK